MVILYLCRQLGDRFGVGRSTVYRSVKSVCQALTSLASDFIQWPSAAQQQDVRGGFAEVRGFPGVIGAVDGTHIPIKCPSEHRESYYNRKKYHSIVLQVTCDHRCRFTDAFTGVPGSRHDAKVFEMSDLGQRMDSDPASVFSAGSHLIGDKAYKLTPYLMTPFRHSANLTAEQVRYNKCQSATRMAIERAIGILKGRFRILRSELDLESVESMVEVIMACCVLHNIALASDSEEDMESLYQTAVQEQALLNHNQVAGGLDQPFAVGTDKRREIVNYLNMHRH